MKPPLEKKKKKKNHKELSAAIFINVASIFIGQVGQH